MHDGISYEQLGKPAAVLCTKPFEVTAKNIARVMGIPDYPFAILQHPLGSCTDEELNDRAADAYQQSKAIILGKS